ncbi:MAG: hypothetical protein ABSC37_08230 [Xanthobacteraceae bacterium]|jgi:hypothetical protein
MKRLAFAIGVLALGFAAAAPARADFAVVKFNSGYCRVWTDTAAGPQDGKYLWFRHHHHWHHWSYRTATWKRSDHRLHRAVHEGRCQHWWP